MHSKPTTVLIIDDEPGHARLALRRMSKDIDLAPQVFTTGRKALEFLHEMPANERHNLVILLDLNMPGMDGYQVLQRIKMNDDVRFIPVIVLSSTDNQDEILRCYMAGANLYLVKQMDYEEYKKTLDFVVDFIHMFRRI